MGLELQLNLDALKTENHHLHGKLQQLERLLDFAPAIININEYPDITRPNLVRNIWANRCSLDFIGYTREELDDMGYNMGDSVTTAEDKTLLKDVSSSEDLLLHLCSYPKKFKAKDGSLKWLQARGQIYQQNEDGLLLQLILVAFELPNNPSFSNTSPILANKNLSPNDLLQFQLPTIREREILRLIAKGFTDKEIAEQLFISVKTAQTHRNKLIKIPQLAMKK